METLPIQLLSNGKAEVIRNFYLQHHLIPAGFTFNGADIPRWCWTLLGYHPYHIHVIRAACLHDYLISLEYSGHARDLAFHAQLLVDGTPKWKANLMSWVVRKYRQLKD